MSEENMHNEQVVKKRGRPKKTSRTSKNTSSSKDVVRKRKRITIPKDEEFIVRSNVVGGLFFKSRNDAIVKDWDDCESIEYMTYEELQKLRSEARKFFEYNWLIIEDNDDYTSEQVYAALGVEKYYSSPYGTPETLDDLFDLDAQDMASAINKMTPGYKETVAARAKELIDCGDIDSRKTIQVLSSLLNIDFEDDI